jgi:CRP-like cAMP-binding protein
MLIYLNLADLTIQESGSPRLFAQGDFKLGSFQLPVPLEPGALSNRILSALPREEYRVLTRNAQMVSLDVGEILYEANEPILHVYFLLDGVCSVVSIMEDGTTVEVTIVGPEGLVGFPALDAPSAVVPNRAFMQIAGQALKIRSEAFRSGFYAAGVLQGLVIRYLQFTLVQIAQSAACNRLHNLEERLARWLLMVHDRVGVNEFNLTHDFLAQMLGTGRASVTLAAGLLHRAGLIEHRRGHIRIVDRDGLIGTACECYRIVKGSWDRLR